MKRTKTLALLATLGLFAGLLVIPAASSSHMFDDDFKQQVSKASQIANSNIQQDANVFAPGPGDVNVDQEANSNIEQDADVSVYGGYADVDQEANSNIGQNADVFAPGPGDVYVDQEANSNIQQSTDVTVKDREKAKKKRYDRDRERDKKRVDREKDRKKHDRFKDRKERKKVKGRKKVKKPRKKHKVKKPRKGKKKKTICHRPPGNPSNARTLSVGKPAVGAHLGNHPDSYGACKKTAGHNGKKHGNGYGYR